MSKAEQLTRDFIEGQLDASREAVEAALVAIYERQTQEERVGAYSIETNGVGFSKFDADFCTSLVQQIKRGKSLTERQLPFARKKMKRYWRQLIVVMTTKVPEPMVDNNLPVLAPQFNPSTLPSVAPRVGGYDAPVERACDLYASW